MASEMSEATSRDVTPRGWRKILYEGGLYLALVPVAAAAIRVWLFSAGDTSLFLLLLRTIDITTVLVGTSLLLVPIVILVGAMAFGMDPRVRAWVTKGARSRAVFGVIFGFLGLAALTLPWRFLLTALGLGVIAHLGTRLLNEGIAWGVRLAGMSPKRTKDPNPINDSSTIVAASTLLFLVASGSMWLPLEFVTLTDETSRVAYVLESDREWTTLLTLDREVSIVATEDVEQRLVCKRMTERSFLMTFLDLAPAGVDCPEP